MPGGWGRAPRDSGVSAATRFRPDTNRPGFTLIELLVVVSIVVLLMALLMPALSRAWKQARAVVCQANLRQWGVVLAMHVNENDGRLPEPAAQGDPWNALGWKFGWAWGDWDRAANDETKGIRCCPTAAKPVNPTGTGSASMIGGTFRAWGRCWPESAPWPHSYGSYADNGCVGHYPGEDARTWRTVNIRGTDRIPVCFDHTYPSVAAFLWDAGEVEPPACDAIPTALGRPSDLFPCINRHDGGINALFLDWSVRRVGLKGLWTLKWSRKFNTAGKWTSAGGVRPED